MPMVVFPLLVVVVAWRVAGRGVAIFSLVSLVLLDLIDVWPETMTTLAMILTAVVFCALVGIPLGILAARRNGFATGLRPVPDIMQRSEERRVGKRVSVRVDLGGRRIIKKKKQNQTSM